MKMRFCPTCEDGIAYGRAQSCAACKAERHRAAARKWYAKNRERDHARRSAAYAPLSPAQRERKRLADKAARIHPNDAQARRELRESWLRHWERRARVRSAA